MALMQQDGRDVIGRFAGADLTGKIFRFVKFNSTNQIIMAVAGDAACGVLVEENQQTVAPYGQVSVQHSGICKVVAGAGISAGNQVQSDANGAAITLAAGKPLGEMIGGDANSGDLVEVKLF